MMLENLIIRQMSREELDVLVEWATAEGWNPGENDADIFWKTDSQGFIAAELNGELVGGGSIVAYEKEFGFMGFFIVKSEFRGKGIGEKLWFARREKLKARLNINAPIGMDGVFNMQDFYSKGGFEFTHREIRFEGIGQVSALAPSVKPLSEMAFEDILAYDKKHFPVKREKFLNAWIEQPNSSALAVVKDEKLVGYGVIRPCYIGYKIGPLFADTAKVASELFNALSNYANGESIFIDVPEVNIDAMKLVANKNMKEVFGCARMYFNSIPNVANENIYGVTTFELG